MSVVTKFPTSNAVHSSGVVNPTNLYADDGTYGTLTPSVSGTERSSDYGTFGFDASIPAGSTINAVKIIYEYKVGSTAGTLLARTAGIVSGSHQGNHDDNSEPLADSIITVDITGDRSWTRADLLDAVFQVHIGAVRTGVTSVKFSFDYVKVEVTYTAPAGFSQAYT